MQFKTTSILFVLIICFVSAGAQLSMKKKGDGILITEEGENVLFYHIKPNNQDGKYERCNYIHPLWGLNGKELTEDFPSDHLHHRGVFWAWHQVWIGDKRIGDPWIINDFKQNVVEFEFRNHTSGEVVLQTEVDWLSNRWKIAGERVPYLKEFGKITIYPKGHNYRRIDFEIVLTPLEDGLRIGGSEDKKGYGGFSVRMALPEDVTFFGSNGTLEPEVCAVESPGFVNISGSVCVNQGKGGIVISDHPGNPGYPQRWILRSKNSMQNAVWPGSDTVMLSRNKPLKLNYSLIVYSGRMKEKKITEILMD